MLSDGWLRARRKMAPRTILAPNLVLPTWQVKYDADFLWQ